MERVYIIGAKRTPIGKFGGTLSSLTASDLGSFVIKGALDQSGLEADQVSQVLMGNVVQAGQGQNPARQAALKAGLPIQVPSITINDVCGSGLSSINMGAALIQAHQADIVVAGGMESMSKAPYIVDQARFGARLGDGRMIDALLSDALTDAQGGYHMGITAENVAKKYDISREEMDEFSYQSHQRAVSAQDKHRFDDEIVSLPMIDRKGNSYVVDQDEAPRRDTSLEKLAKLKPVYQEDGAVTAGNASGLNDGAAAVVLISESKMHELGIEPLAQWQASALVGLEPELMGIGSYYAVEKLFKDHPDFKQSEVDYFELNEAFAAPSLVVGDQLLGLDPAIVNPNGGAIALGHPVGASGSRILVTLIYELIHDDKKTGVAALCVGGGMGVSALITR
ncbi:acetyl-CoA acetyltransferase [Weissella koreensis KCTC 3621]|uniref:thiolase family protein n=1 Tax=Weissella koreensis TaxID=165096 RepID=UPI0002175A87|nr:acetyl-CoA C-acetyltransferase [Weissella koreensis]AEJ24174.1 acetyl-CoA acetyltransferase [Weissella koreensis KACC 15510]EJF34776.1 acetyl-CoA acetyltransferase [Weissella koreensis KCTC 3621]